MRQSLRPAFQIFVHSVFLSMIVFVFAAHADPPKPAQMPVDRAVLGDAFVEAWTVLRRDLDTMSHGGAHPALLKIWFAEAPRFLVRDAAVFANEQSVVLAAGRRLAKNSSREDLSILTDLLRRYEDTQLSFEFRALLISAGDEKTLESAHKNLESSNPEIALDAAAALTVSGDKDGIAFLREQVSTCGDAAGYAARILGRYGQKSDLALLQKTESGGCSNPLLTVAEGEIEARRLFPLHHEMIVRRDPAASQRTSLDGLYDSWFIALRRVFENGATTTDQVIEGIEEIRHEARGDDEGEVVRRRLKEFIEFWTGVDSILKSTKSSPIWPSNFDEAIKSIRLFANSGKQPGIFEKRVSACIAICAATAPRLGHEKLAAGIEIMRSLTPDGDRAGDGSFSTSWRATAGAKLVIVLDTSKKVRNIWLSNTCADEAGPRILEIVVEGVFCGKTWSAKKKLLEKTRYFQKIGLEGRRAERLTIIAEKLEGTGLACVSEIRVR